MPVIDCSELQKSFGDRVILSDVTLTIRSGERVGLVGNSGCGKSTLGLILAGVEELDGGTIARRRATHSDYLEQEPRFAAGQTASQVVLSSLGSWNEAKQRYDSLTAALTEGKGDIDRLVAEQATAAEAVERLGGWERLHEAEAIIDHLGIDDPNRLVENMSGGERRRVALARLLVGKPDLAILDEPTNHLDVDTIEWLESYLIERFRGALLLITHDRYVLDRVATRTLELHEGVLTSYDGGYATYLEAKAERLAHAERVEKNRQNFLRRELDWFRSQPKARGTKQKARMDRVQQALDQTGPRHEQAADLRTGSRRQGKTILRVSGIRLERAGRLLVDGLDLDLMSGERIGILGPNGVGKTSLLLCLLGQLEPSAGECVLGSNTRLGYLDQSRADLDDEETIREAVAGDRPVIEVAGEELRVGAYLERFLFRHSDQRKKLSVLSGGERARVCLARLLSQKSNLLLFDEPTNDLDVSTLGALESMLLEYRGSALIVSHDRWFLDRVATSILAFEGDGVVDLHRGNYSAYREKQSGKEPRRPKATEGRRKTAGKAASPPARRVKKLSWAEERELEGLFENIEAAEEAAAAVEARLADPATYQEPGADEIGRLTRELEEARERAAGLISRWEELEARKAEHSG